MVCVCVCSYAVSGGAGSGVCYVFTNIPKLYTHMHKKLANMESKPVAMEISDAKLEELAKNPDNLVLKYKDRKRLPVDQILPLAAVRQCITDLWTAVESFKTEELQLAAHGTMNTEQACRLHALLIKSGTWTSFSKTHPLIFDRCVNKDTTNKEITALLYMIFLKQQEESGLINDGAHQLQNYVLHTFASPGGA